MIFTGLRSIGVALMALLSCLGAGTAGYPLQAPDRSTATVDVSGQAPQRRPTVAPSAPSAGLEAPDMDSAERTSAGLEALGMDAPDPRVVGVRRGGAGGGD